MDDSMNHSGNQAAQQPETATAKQSRPRRNTMARWALALALTAWVLFALSAFVPLSASWVLGSASGIVALAAFILGLVSLRRAPRGISTAALVFSGVIVLIFILVIIGVKMLQAIPAAQL